jgi:hypothetical protein
MIREIIDIYNRNLLLILLLSLLIIFPITIAGYFAIMLSFEIDNLSTPSYFAGLLLLINFVICAPPFLKLVLIDMEDDKMTMKQGFLFFIKQLGPLLVITILLYFAAIYSMWMFFIPSVLILIFLLVFPYFSDEKQLKKMVSKTIKKVVDENFVILIDLIIVISLSLLVWAIMMYFMQNYENNIYGYMILRGVLNVISLPLIYIYLSLRYRNEMMSVET